MDEAKEKAELIKQEVDVFCIFKRNNISILQLQQKFLEKWTNNLNATDHEGLKLSIRLPDARRIDCCLSRSASTKVKFEY